MTDIVATPAQPNLLDFTFEELESFFTESLGQPRFRATQVWHWLWVKNVSSFEAMTNVSQSLRAQLAEQSRIVRPSIEKVQESTDGTIKFLLRLADGEMVESVLIPSTAMEGGTRMTQCLSCQVGCVMGCTFCSTGSMGFTRNMSMGEILGQVQIAREYLGDTQPERPIIRNLVYMGMGEPLLNLNEVTRSLHTLHHPKGLNFSTRRMTVSTCGISNGLKELGESGLAYLAVSLHAPTQELRAQIMPKAARWPLSDLIRTLENYPLNAREHITLEYLLLGGVNDGPEQARELIRICSRLKAKLNLIPYNPTPGSPYKAPTQEAILRFEQILWAKKITAVLRKSKGQDIDAACGQLCVQAGKAEKKQMCDQGEQA